MAYVLLIYFETPDDLPGIIDALSRFIQVLIANYGIWGTLGIFGFIFLLFFGWRVYNNYRKDREVNLALQEKDRTIQRLAEQERNYRILFFKEKAGWTDDQVDRFVLKNEFPDAPSARKALEGGHQSNPAQAAEKPKPRERKKR